MEIFDGTFTLKIQQSDEPQPFAIFDGSNVTSKWDRCENGHQYVNG